MVDTNVLFSLFWKKSILPKVMASQDLELFSPEFSLEEIKKHEPEIRRKTGLSKHEFNSKREELPILLEFIALDEYKGFFKHLKKVPDKDDIDFLALALKLNCPIWSQDKALKKQSKVKVLTTKELLEKI